MEDIYGLTAENFLSVFPIALRGDQITAALAEMAAETLEKRADETGLSCIYPNVMSLPEGLLDILAYDFKVDWWDADYSLEEKRRTLRDNWFVHKRLGTKAAVETALSAVYPGTAVEEWFEYGGEPYRFRVHAKLADAEYENGKNRRVRNRIAWYKNLRSHLDYIWYELQPIIFAEKSGELWFRDLRFWLGANNFPPVFLTRGNGRLWLVGVGIAARARSPNRLDPVFFRCGGIGVSTRERVPLTLDMGLYWFENLGHFIRLDGKDFLDGSWLLDQRPGPTWFVGFGGRTRIIERNKLGWDATLVVVPHRNGNALGTLGILAGVYPFAPVVERVTGGSAVPRFRFREGERAWLSRLLWTGFRWPSREKVSLTEGLALGWRNRRGFGTSGLSFGTEARENTGTGPLCLEAGIYAQRETVETHMDRVGLASTVCMAAGSNAARHVVVGTSFQERNELHGSVETESTALFDGTYTFDGSIRFDSGTITKEEF